MGCGSSTANPGIKGPEKITINEQSRSEAYNDKPQTSPVTPNPEKNQPKVSENDEISKEIKKVEREVAALFDQMEICKKVRGFWPELKRRKLQSFQRRETRR